MEGVDKFKSVMLIIIACCAGIFAIAYTVYLNAQLPYIQLLTLGAMFTILVYLTSL